MADYNSSHVGTDIDTSVSKILTVDGDGGLVSKNFLTNTLEDYLPAGEYLTLTAADNTYVSKNLLASTLEDYTTHTYITSTYEPLINNGTSGLFYRGDKIWSNSLAGDISIGVRNTSTAPSSLTYANRITIIPYYHTGGPWYIKSADDANNSYITLHYNTSEIIRFKHTGTISAISSTTPVITHEPIAISYIAGVKGNGAGVYCKKDLNASQWYPMIATDTYAGGGWAIGTYTSEALLFVYGTKANKDSNVNTTSILNLNAGNGTITTSVSSSIKIKENIHEFSIEEAKKLLLIRTVTFDYKQGYGEKNQYGFIAEEVDNIIPYVVYKPTDNILKDKNEYWSIEYHKFIPWIVKLLLIQQQEINELRQKINL